MEFFWTLFSLHLINFCQKTAGRKDVICIYLTSRTVKLYGKLKQRIRKNTDIPVIDALSHYEYYRDDLVDLPAVATDSVDLFIQNKVDFLVYYCNAQCDKYLSNRFFSMPSQRTRILGMQLYLSGAKGFLHWGFNFYNSGFSIFPIDPYKVSDAGGFSPLGIVLSFIRQRTVVLLLCAFLCFMTEYRTILL